MTQVKCPRCKQKTEYSPKNSYRPFCSERCKMIDLGNWADETYNIPSTDEEGYNVNENPDDPDRDPSWGSESSFP